jgi:hypothetical protein
MGSLCSKKQAEPAGEPGQCSGCPDCPHGTDKSPANDAPPQQAAEGNQEGTDAVAPE